MTQDRDPEISESTRRLIDALGDRPGFAARPLRRREPTREPRRGFALGFGHDISDRDYEELYFARRPSRGSAGPPRYLVAAAQAITRNEHIRLWLHGEDARERDRACDWLSSFAAAWGWEPVTVSLTRNRGSDYQFQTERGEILARQLIMAWQDPTAPAPMRAFEDFALSGPPLAIILRDPGLITEPRLALLTQAADSLRQRAGGGLLAVCSESPSDHDIPGFESIACESPLAEAGRRIAALRAERNMSRGDLAAISGLPETLLAMLESGVERSRTSDPDEAIHLIERLAEALAVPVDELLPVDEHPNAP